MAVDQNMKNMYADLSGAPVKGRADPQYIDPFISGYYYIHWFRKPLSMDDMGIDSSFFDDITRVLATRVTLPGVTLNTTEVVTSFSNASKISTPTTIERDNSFSVAFTEMNGLPVMRNIEKWVFSIRDPMTGLSRLKNYGVKGFSGDMLVILIKPVLTSAQGTQQTSTGLERADIVEKAYLFTNAFPTNVPDDILSPDLATSDQVIVDITFKYSNCVINDKVTEAATKLLASDDNFETTGMPEYTLATNKK